MRLSIAIDQLLPRGPSKVRFRHMLGVLFLQLSSLLECFLLSFNPANLKKS
jgi:hypothetical protein